MLDDVIDVEPRRHPMCLVGSYDPRNNEDFDILEDHPDVRAIEAFEPQWLFSAALRAGWQSSQAMRFREVAVGVPKRPSKRLGPRALKRWRSEATDPHEHG